MARKGKENKQNTVARNNNEAEYVSMDVFIAFQQEVWQKLDKFEIFVTSLENKIDLKDRRIEELEGKLLEKDNEIKDILKSQDRLERDINVVEGGFILSGKDFHEIDGEEYGHFENEFQSKMYSIAKEKDVNLGNQFQSSVNFISDQLSESNNYLVRVGNMSKGVSERMERFISNDMARELNGFFEWTGLDGKQRSTYIKRNKTFTGRKMSQLMYKVYKKIEDETNDEIQKEWRRGKLYLNKVPVDIVRSVKQIQAVMQGTMVAEVKW
mmetsp:Transcript_12804/g.16823  ORF Transcript_12804/g.16823 Transcript_12804/m.16823 type:complete len:268 (+) Transcript_12804:45-848(+)